MAVRASLIRYLAEAGREYLEQIDYYEAQTPGLGARFIEAVEAAEHLVLANPAGWRRVENSVDMHCVIVKRFPFRLLYAVRHGEVVVTAVAHTSRDPARFVGR